MLEAGEVERLGHVGEDTRAERLGRVADILVGGDHDDRHPDVEALHLLQELEAAHPWHVHVEQHEVELADEQLHDRGGAVGHRLDLIRESRRGIAQELPEHLEYGRLVVDDQHPLGHTR